MIPLRPRSTLTDTLFPYTTLFRSYLVNGGVTNALNMPSLSAEEAPKLKPYMAPAETLGSLIGQLAHGPLSTISIEVEGADADLNLKPLTRQGLGRLMRVCSHTRHMVHEQFLARGRGLYVRGGGAA